MLTQKFISKILLAAVAIAPALSGQVNSLSRERLIKYTSQNPYERFPDGRPNILREVWTGTVGGGGPTLMITGVAKEPAA